MNEREKNPESHHTRCRSGTFLFSQSITVISVLQRIDQAVIVVDGYAVNHSVPQLFVKLDGRCALHISLYAEFF